MTSVTTTGSDPDGHEPIHAGPDRVSLLRMTMAVIWTIAIFAVCWLPGDYVREVEHGSRWFRIPNADKLVHCGIFLVFAILWRRLGRSRRIVWAVLVGGFAAAALSEIGQLMPFVGRDADIYDFVLDSVGVVLGIAIAPLVEIFIAPVERLLFRHSSQTLAKPVPPES